METKSTREEYLLAARDLTCGSRDIEYGPPMQNLSDCAALFTAYLEGKTRGRIIAATGGELMVGQYELTAEDVAWLNVLQKVARTFSGQPKEDTYIDAAAYAAIAGECADDK